MDAYACCVDDSAYTVNGTSKIGRLFKVGNLYELEMALILWSCVDHGLTFGQ